MTDEEITNYLRDAGVVEAVLPFSEGSMRILRRYTELILERAKKDAE
jgi:hypothetical protein